MTDTNPWKEVLADISVEASALSAMLTAPPSPWKPRESLFEVWAPCTPPVMVSALDCESAARRYVRKTYQPRDRLPSEVFTRGPGGLRLVSLTYPLSINAEVSP